MLEPKDEVTRNSRNVGNYAPEGKRLHYRRRECTVESGIYTTLIQQAHFLSVRF
jgi:hypothetical protein